MRIAAVDTFVLKIDNDEPYLGVLPDGTGPADGYAVRPPWRSLYSPRFETVLVRLTAGWGEALAPVGPEIVAAVVRTTLAGQLVGADARSPRPVVRAAAELMRERGHLVGPFFVGAGETLRQRERQFVGSGALVNRHQLPPADM